MSRRTMMKWSAMALVDASVSSDVTTPLMFAGRGPRQTANSGSTEQWNIFEASFQGPQTGNPFVDVELTATFQQGDKIVKVSGFYYGGGTYRIRFMPQTTGKWTYRTSSNHSTLNGKTGSLLVKQPGADNHGPVHVRDTYHFAYADGSPYREIGTTCYAWTHQPEELEERTLKTLSTAPFNKVRMCVFPKWYVYNHVEPRYYPFEGTAPNQWDFTRFNPLFFQHFEKRIGQLRDMGIQADLILFHPYDHWAFDKMDAASDDRYLRYVVARLAAYRNVWWSFANEWDFVKSKTPEDWERFGQLVQESDPYNHLRSIHNGAKFFDHSRPWITHVSVQNDQPDNAAKYLRTYNKPVIFDECRYEGNIPEGWGDITSERLVGAFWKTHIAGAFCGHGETYLNPQEELWWSKGGTLRGQSPPRIAFFKQIIDAAPEASGPLTERNTWGVAGEYYLTYLWDRQHASQTYRLPESIQFTADIIDTLEMTVTRVPGTFSGQAQIPLPIKPYQAVRVMRT